MLDFVTRKSRAFGPVIMATAVAGVLLVAAAGLGRGRVDAGGLALPAERLESPRVVVIKSRRILHLYDGNRLVRTFPIELGRVPDGPKRFARDGRTPEGSFRIVTRNPGSAFHRFLGIDYPGLDDAERGLASGLISEGEAEAIRAVHARGECPSWATALGGGIGLHGGASGGDSTEGCVALSDEHIEVLDRVLRIGDPVEILP